LVYIRQKEDPWNSIVVGASTGGFDGIFEAKKIAGGGSEVKILEF